MNGAFAHSRSIHLRGGLSDSAGVQLSLPLPVSETSALRRRLRRRSECITRMQGEPGLRRSQANTLFETGRWDEINCRRLLNRIAGLFHTISRPNAVGWTSGSEVRLLRGFTYLHPLERHLRRTRDPSNNVVRLVPAGKYAALDRNLSFYVSRQSIRGRTKNELAWLTYRMSARGCGLTGDIVQMTPAEVLLHACTIPAIRNPEKLVVQLGKALGRLGLGFEMAAPGWRRDEGPTIEELIAQRDARKALRERTAKRARPAYLQLVAP
jgi:hypothetical protein